MGYDSKLNMQYDEIYIFGNTTVYIIAPKITEEENQKQWDKVCKNATTIIKNMLQTKEV